MRIRVTQQSRQWRAAKEGETPAFWASSPALALWAWERKHGPIPAGTVVQVGEPVAQAVASRVASEVREAEPPPPAPTPAHETPDAVREGPAMPMPGEAPSEDTLCINCGERLSEHLRVLTDATEAPFVRKYDFICPTSVAKAPEVPINGYQ